MKYKNLLLKSVGAAVLISLGDYALLKLGNPIGPVTINAQYIFGNLESQIWVDAVTGDVKNSNPAFPDSLGFKMPLGEWP